MERSSYRETWDGDPLLGGFMMVAVVAIVIFLTYSLTYNPFVIPERAIPLEEILAYDFNRKFWIWVLLVDLWGFAVFLASINLPVRSLGVLRRSG